MLHLVILSKKKIKTQTFQCRFENFFTRPSTETVGRRQRAGEVSKGKNKLLWRELELVKEWIYLLQDVEWTREQCTRDLKG